MDSEKDLPECTSGLLVPSAWWASRGLIPALFSCSIRLFSNFAIERASSVSKYIHVGFHRQPISFCYIFRQVEYRSVSIPINPVKDI